MSAGNLQKDLEQRAQNFIQDRFLWKQFVSENYDHLVEKMGEISAQYRELIDKYCGSEKQHQGLALSSNAGHKPDEEHIVSFEQNGKRAIVFTQVRHADGGIEPHEFEFILKGDEWLLGEVYYNDGSGRYECL